MNGSSAYGLWGLAAVNAVGLAVAILRAALARWRVPRGGWQLRALVLACWVAPLVIWGFIAERQIREQLPLLASAVVVAGTLLVLEFGRRTSGMAMVIIAREFAVSGLRVAAGQQGVVIPASILGKAKTILQVAMVMALIAADDSGAAWVQALVYLAVAMTVISGADYFLNVRKRIEEARRRRLGDQTGGTRSTS